MIGEIIRRGPPQISGPAGSLLLAEIVGERSRINREWEEEGADSDVLTGATVELQHKVLLAIQDGRVDPVAAAAAALGTEAH